MTVLKNPFPAVRAAQEVLYGGNQMLLPRKYVRNVSCGVVAAVNLLLYLETYNLRGATGRFADGLDEQGQISLDDYNRLAEYLRHRFIPVLPRFGVIGYGLPLGLNGYFRRYRIPFRAIWCVSHRKLWMRMETMLKADLPVILSIGPNWPCRWGKAYLQFYRKDVRGNYQKGPRTRAHYVTVTAMDEEWLEISSWGQRFYISRREYDSYVKKSSNYVFSNLLLLIPRKRR